MTCFARTLVTWVVAFALLPGCVFLDDYGKFEFAAGSPDGGSDGGVDDVDVDGEVPVEPCDRSDTVYVAIDGDDANPGTLDAPLATLVAALAKVADDEGLTRIYLGAGDFEGHYETPSQIVLVDGVTLRGGFSSDFCTYDPATYVTRIVEIFGRGVSDDVDPVESPITTVVAYDLPNGVVLEGLRIVLAEESDDAVAGIRLARTSAVLRDVVVEGGDGKYLHGIQVEDAPELTLERVTVSLQRSYQGGAAIRLDDVEEAVLREVRVDRPYYDSSFQYTAVRSEYHDVLAPKLTIERSMIHGGRSTSWTAGIIVEDFRASGTRLTARVVNNLVHAGEKGGQSYAIKFTGRSQGVSILHNTVYLGEATGFAYGISYEYAYSGADIRNNIIFADETNHFCVQRTGDGTIWNGMFETLSNNLFFDCPFALLSNGSTRIQTIEALNALSNVSANHLAASSPLADFTGPDLLAGTMANNDWGLAEGVPCTYARGGFAIPSVTTDFYGRTRSATPTIGAIEFTGECTP